MEEDLFEGLKNADLGRGDDLNREPFVKHLPPVLGDVRRYGRVCAGESGGEEVEDTALETDEVRSAVVVFRNVGFDGFPERFEV